jgi:hypothetical protein
MEGENRQEINQQEESHEKIKKMGLLASGLLATIINAGIVQEGYTAPMMPFPFHPIVPLPETKPIIPKQEITKEDNGAIILTPGMTKEQIEGATQRAIERHESEQAFQQVLDGCVEMAKLSDGQKQATENCISWYKAEAEHSRGDQALHIIQNKITAIKTAAEKENLTDADQLALGLTLGILAGFAIVFVAEELRNKPNLK